MAKPKAQETVDVKSVLHGQRRIEYLPLNELQPATRNPKAHNQPDLQKSIGRFGFTEPIILDERTGRLVAGHGRLEGLQALKAKGSDAPEGVEELEGEWRVPVVRGWHSRSDADAEAYLLASNQLTISGGWNNGELAEMLKGLADQDAALLDGLGFAAQDVSDLLDAHLALNTPEDLDDVPELPADKDVWVKKGDMFQLGKHRIICGDCTDPAAVDAVMMGDEADICWTDPPWNVAYGENTNPAGWSKKHDVIANDNLGEDFPQFCADFSGQMARVMKPGAMLYLAMSAQEWPAIHGALVAMGFHWSSTIIWAKDSLVLSRKDYHTQYEPIWYGWKEGSRLCPLDDRKQSDLWQVARPKKSDEHPTMKPVELIERSLKNSSKRGDVCFEPFSGSGSTLLACEQTGRTARCVELMPKYVQVALERWEKLTGLKAEKIAEGTEGLTHIGA